MGCTPDMNIMLYINCNWKINITLKKLFLYINSTQWEILKIPFTIASQCHIPSNKFNKIFARLMLKNWKVMREIREGLDKWKAIPSSWTEKFKIKDANFPQMCVCLHVCVNIDQLMKEGE